MRLNLATACMLIATVCGGLSAEQAANSSLPTVSIARAGEGGAYPGQEESRPLTLTLRILQLEGDDTDIEIAGEELYTADDSSLRLLNSVQTVRHVVEELDERHCISNDAVGFFSVALDRTTSSSWISRLGDDAGRQLSITAVAHPHITTQGKVLMLVEIVANSTAVSHGPTRDRVLRAGLCVGRGQVTAYKSPSFAADSPGGGPQERHRWIVFASLKREANPAMFKMPTRLPAVESHVHTTVAPDLRPVSDEVRARIEQRTRVGTD